MKQQRSVARARVPAVLSMALAMSVSPGFIGKAQAVTDDDLKELREQLRQLKQQYENRIEALEKRLQQAEQAAGNAQVTASRAASTATKAENLASNAENVAQTAAVQASQRPTGENAMNPGMSLILNGTYGNL